jgi:hypothetical protein
MDLSAFHAAMVEYLGYAHVVILPKRASQVSSPIEWQLIYRVLRDGSLTAAL